MYISSSDDLVIPLRVKCPNCGKRFIVELENKRKREMRQILEHIRDSTDGLTGDQVVNWAMLSIGLRQDQVSEYLRILKKAGCIRLDAEKIDSENWRSANIMNTPLAFHKELPY